MTDRIGHCRLAQVEGCWCAIADVRCGAERFRRQVKLSPSLSAARKLMRSTGRSLNAEAAAWLESHGGQRPRAMPDVEKVAQAQAAQLREAYQSVRPVAVGPAHWWR